MGRLQHYDEIILFGFSWVFWHFRRLSFFYSLSVWLHELSPFLPAAPGILNYIWWVREKESIYLSKKKGDRTSTADSFIGRCSFSLKALAWDIMKPEKDVTLQLKMIFLTLCTLFSMLFIYASDKDTSPFLLRWKY